MNATFSKYRHATSIVYVLPTELNRQPAWRPTTKEGKSFLKINIMAEKQKEFNDLPNEMFVDVFKGFDWTKQDTYNA